MPQSVVQVPFELCQAWGCPGEPVPVPGHTVEKEPFPNIQPQAPRHSSSRSPSRRVFTPPLPLRVVPASPQPLTAVPAIVSPQGGSRRDVPRTPRLVLAERQPGPAGALG